MEKKYVKLAKVGLIGLVLGGGVALGEYVNNVESIALRQNLQQIEYSQKQHQNLEEMSSDEMLAQYTRKGLSFSCKLKIIT